MSILCGKPSNGPIAFPDVISVGGMDLLIRSYELIVEHDPYVSFNRFDDPHYSVGMQQIRVKLDTVVIPKLEQKGLIITDQIDIVSKSQEVDECIIKPINLWKETNPNSWSNLWDRIKRAIVKGL